MHPFFRLRDRMAWLAFDPLIDAPSHTQPEFLDYLDFYKLHYSEDICRQHFMGVFEAAGYQLVAQYWLPTGVSPKGTVFFLHGYYDHVGLFSAFIGFLLRQGWIVVAYDQPGHGLSSGEQASIKDFGEYVQILQCCLQRSIALPQPWFGVAQSTGCAVFLRALMKERMVNPFKKIVLLAPLIRPAHWGRAVWLYRALAPFSKQLGRYKYANSHDPFFLEFIHHQDPLQSKYLKTAWVGAMKRWLEEFPSLRPVSADLLVIQGEKDETVDWRYNIPLLQHKLKGGQYHCLPGAAHHLLNEREDLRQEVFGQINDFLLAS